MRALRLPLLVTGASASVLTFAGSAHALSVHVQRNLSSRQNVHVTFRAQKLPEGGYYYGVLVLKPYKKYTRTSPPPCSTSSNMSRTEYGYPKPDGEVPLTLTPAESLTRHWCRSGSYSGAIYAVPQPPPCEGRYPCRSERYTIPQCFTSGGRQVCGLVLPKGWRYPEGLPTPLATGTRIVARFTVRFP
jgi:hypothetical protein